MGNSMHCKKLKPTSRNPKEIHSNSTTNNQERSKAASNPNFFSKLPPKELLERIKLELDSGFISNKALDFLTSIELNSLISTKSREISVSSITSLLKDQDTELLLDLSNKIYVKIISESKKLDENIEFHGILMSLTEKMQSILEEQLSLVCKLDINNLIYHEIPIKYLEIMVEFFQLVSFFAKSGGNRAEVQEIWWNSAKYGEKLEFYESRFIELVGKLRYEHEIRENKRVSSKNPRKTLSFVGYGFRRTQIKKNTQDIRDASEDILKEKVFLARIVGEYLEELGRNACEGFRKMIAVLKEKNENITEIEEDYREEMHGVPISRTFCAKKKRNKR